MYRRPPLFKLCVKIQRLTTPVLATDKLPGSNPVNYFFYLPKKIFVYIVVNALFKLALKDSIHIFCGHIKGFIILILVFENAFDKVIKWLVENCTSLLKC